MRSRMFFFLAEDDRGLRLFGHRREDVERLDRRRAEPAETRVHQPHLEHSCGGEHARLLEEQAVLGLLDGDEGPSGNRE